MPRATSCRVWARKPARRKRRTRSPCCARRTKASLLLAALLAGCAHPLGEGAPFGVFGDTPYTDAEVAQVDRLIEQMNAAPLAFVAHVGDIGAGARACTDDWLRARKQQFSRIRHPLILVPGDNEWTDCKDQMQRLKAWRALFCFPANGLDLTFQKGEFCEHVRWESAGTLFVALNVPGSNNNVRRPDEYAPRMEAVFAWIDQSAALARQRGLRLALLMQADPFVISPRDGYGALREKLRQLAAGQSTVLIHGDTHVYRDDEPMPGLRRIEVWGSPVVDWLRLAF